MLTHLELERERTGNVAIIGLKGILNADTSPQVDKAFEELLASKTLNVVVDFGKTDYISSAGISCFISVLKEFRQGQGDIRFASLSPKNLRILQLLDFEDLFKIFPSRQAAVESFATEHVPG